MFSLLIALRNLVIIVLLSWLGVSTSADHNEDETAPQQPNSQIGFTLLR